LGQSGIPLEALYDKTHSLYKLVVLVSRRATELNSGAVALTKQQSDNVIGMALQEVVDGKISWVKDKSKKTV
jgi:DNA-directed RNA polymerase omega subunit